MNQEPTLPYKEDKNTFLRILNQLIFFSFLIFVAYLVRLINKYGQEEALGVFKEVRDKTYGVLVIIFVVLGFWMMLEGKKEEKTSKEPITKLIACLLLAVVFITFAYSAALLVVDLLNLVGLS